MMNITNPATEEIIAQIQTDTSEDIQQKYQQAKSAQKKWSSQTVAHRIHILTNFYSLLEEHQTELAATLTAEVGKPLWQSVNELNGARHRIQYFLKNAERWLKEEVLVEEENLLEKIVFEPLGVVGNISAWNYPYLVGVNVFVPALIAGNAVLYKPSEFATLTGKHIGKLLHQAGVPETVFQVVTGGATAGQALLELPLDGYFFTGSYKTGQYIYQQVASKMVPCQLELGGKDPIYISADNQDVKKVAQAAAEGVFYNNGQSCCAVERIYVHETLYEEFVKHFVEEVKTYKIGSPTTPDTFLGPLTRKDQISIIAAQIQDAQSKGATVLLGGTAKEGKGYFFEPTVVVNVNHNMSIMKEESFGPVIGIQKVSNDEEAIERMLDTDYGLTAGVYADNRKNAEPILNSMNSGTVYWNCCDRVSPFVPWSGRKHSGIGSTLSYLGVRTFVKPKSYQLKGKW